MKITSIANLIGACTVAVFFTACDSKEENMRENALEKSADKLENKADLTRKNGEKAADAAEDTADKIRKNNGTAADQAEDAADTTRKVTERQADALENEADKAREAK